MSAEILPYDGQYTTLRDVIPLSTPFNVTISIGNVCDFRCSYCAVQNIILDKHKKTHFMTIDEFKVIVSQFKEFNRPIQRISFVSAGETILNHALPEMIHLIKQEKVAKEVKIITNANSLTNDYTDQLINAGIDIIKISIQGLSDERYQQICNPIGNFSFNRLVDQIRYLYEHRGTCKVHIKIIDVALELGEEKMFYDIFSPIADVVYIEKCFDNEAKTNKYENCFDQCDICPMPFYFIYIDVNGNVFPCCMEPMIHNKENAFGNVYEKNLKKLWDVNFRQLQVQLLNKSIGSNHVCFGCKQFRSVEKKMNILDGYEMDIITRY